MTSILNKKNVLLSPANNNSNGFSQSNSNIIFNIAPTNDYLSPYKKLELSFLLTLTNDTTAYVNPSVALHSLIEQITINSTKTGTQLWLSRFYGQTANEYNQNGYLKNMMSAHTLKNSRDYFMTKTVLSAYDGTIYHVSVPLNCDFIASHLLQLSLEELGGLTIIIKLASNNTVFYDTASTATYSLTDLNLHYQTLILNKVVNPTENKSVLMKTLDTGTDTILSTTENRDVMASGNNLQSFEFQFIPSQISNSYSGDSFLPYRLCSVDANYNPEMETDNTYGLLNFSETLNGLTLPIQSILSTRTATATSQLGSMLNELLKSQLSSPARKIIATDKTLYNYDNIVLQNSAFATGGAPINPWMIYPQATDIVYFNGLNDLPKFKLGVLLNRNGAQLQQCNLTYKLISNISETYNVYVFMKSIKRINLMKNNGINVISVVN